MKTTKMDDRPLTFESDDVEGAYWETHSTAPHWDTMEPVPVRVDAQRRPAKMVSLRIPEEYLTALKAVAHSKGIPYQTLLRLWLVERLRQEGAL